MGEAGLRRGERMPEPQHGLGDDARLRTGEAHDADAATAGWGRDRYDRIVRISGDKRHRMKYRRPEDLFFGDGSVLDRRCSLPTLIPGTVV